MRAAFYKSTRPGLAGVYNRLVRWFERGPHSHCELIFSDGMAASSSFMDGGVRFKKIDFDPAKWDFLDLPPEKEARARAWFVKHEGEKYDLMGNVRFMFGWVSDSPDKWFCSEALAASLGIKDPFRYGPNTLFSALQLMKESK